MGKNNDDKTSNKYLESMLDGEERRRREVEDLQEMELRPKSGGRFDFINDHASQFVGVLPGTNFDPNTAPKYQDMFRVVEGHSPRSGLAGQLVDGCVRGAFRVLDATAPGSHNVQVLSWEYEQAKGVDTVLSLELAIASRTLAPDLQSMPMLVKPGGMQLHGLEQELEGWKARHAKVKSEFDNLQNSIADRIAAVKKDASSDHFTKRLRAKMDAKYKDAVPEALQKFSDWVADSATAEDRQTIGIWIAQYNNEHKK